MPNSKLVSQRVINWSYGDPRTQIPILVGVAYDSDVELVTETLILAAQGVENVLEDPSPRVQFLKFGDSSLDFRLLVWSVQPRRYLEIKSDINYRICGCFVSAALRSHTPPPSFGCVVNLAILDTAEKAPSDPHRP